MATVKPTMFDTGKREVLPSVDPDKRVGGGEYTTPTPNTKELVEESGLWERSLNSLGIKSLRQERDVWQKKIAEKLTIANVLPLGADPKKFHERFLSLEENPLLKNIGAGDIKRVVLDGDIMGFNPKEAITTAVSSLGIQGDFSNLSDMDISDISKIAGQFASTSGYNDISKAFEFLGRVNDGYTEFTEAGNNAEGIMGLMGSLFGESELFEYLNLGAEASFLHALIEKAIDWNLPEYVDKFTGMVYNNELKQQSVEMNLSYAATQANYDIFEKLWVNLSDELRVKNRDRYLRELIQNFKAKADENSTEKCLHMLRIMDTVGPGWDKDPDDAELPYVYYYSFATKEAVDEFDKMPDRCRLGWAGFLAQAKTSQEIIRLTIPNFTL